MTYSVLIPNRYQEIIQPLVQSLYQFEPDASVVIIADHHTNNYGFDIIKHEMEKFSFSRAVNMGIEARPLDDIILINDDCVLLKPSFHQLSEIAYMYPTVGILSPLIRGCVGNPVQRFHEYRKHWLEHENLKFVCGNAPVCFPCVYLKRDMIRKIGLMDETISGYGYDDNEYCERARRMEWETGVTCKVIVQHGDGARDLTRGKTWSLSFARKEKECRSIEL